MLPVFDFDPPDPSGGRDASGVLKGPSDLVALLPDTSRRPFELRAVPAGWVVADDDYRVFSDVRSASLFWLENTIISGVLDQMVSARVRAGSFGSWPRRLSVPQAESIYAVLGKFLGAPPDEVDVFRAALVDVPSGVFKFHFWGTPYILVFEYDATGPDLRCELSTAMYSSHLSVLLCSFALFELRRLFQPTFDWGPFEGADPVPETDKPSPEPAPETDLTNPTPGTDIILWDLFGDE